MPERLCSYKIQSSFRKIKYGNENICFFAARHIQTQTLVLFTPARCERVARERAGGEQGWLFAGQKASRVHPSIAAASEAPAATMRRVLNAGRWNLKDRLQTGPLYLRTAKGVRGKAWRLPPNGALRAPGVRGGARGPRRKALHFSRKRPFAVPADADCCVVFRAVFAALTLCA